MAADIDIKQLKRSTAIAIYELAALETRASWFGNMKIGSGVLCLNGLFVVFANLFNWPTNFYYSLAVVFIAAICCRFHCRQNALFQEAQAIRERLQLPTIEIGGFLSTVEDWDTKNTLNERDTS